MLVEIGKKEGLRNLVSEGLLFGGLTRLTLDDLYDKKIFGHLFGDGGLYRLACQCVPESLGRFPPKNFVFSF